MFASRLIKIFFGIILVLVGIVGLLVPVMPGWLLIIPGLVLINPEKGKYWGNYIKLKIKSISNYFE